MAEYGRFCPVAIATEILADRWTLLVVRELLLGNTRFNDIARGLPGISRTLLVQRLRHLERRGVLETWPAASGRGNEYHLTQAGRDLEGVVNTLAEWVVEWYFDELRPDDVDPVTLTWWMHRRIDHERLPPGRVVVHFRYTEPDALSLWMVLDHGQASVCLTSPGFDDDVVVTSSVSTLGEIFGGSRSWRHAIDDGEVHLHGPPRLVNALPGWFVGSPFAESVRARMRRAPTT